MLLVVKPDAKNSAGHDGSKELFYRCGFICHLETTEDVARDQSNRMFVHPFAETFLSRRVKKADDLH